VNTLRAENLVKKFDLTDEQRRKERSDIKSKIAVDNVSFEITEGDVFGLIGANGAGKTTTMKMLSTLIKPTSGNIYYNDVSIFDDPDNIRKQFAFLTTDLKLDARSTPSEMFDFFAELYGLDKEFAKQRKQILFNTFGIDEFQNKKIVKLSQGMKQKTSLAISIIHDPAFIIFDEPTNGLDVLAAKEVRDFILSMRDEGKCIIISTHIFDLIEKTCNKVALIVDGKIIKNDTLERVMKNKSLEDAFYEIYTQQIKEDAT
jgi:sodium transport system ATP-binding protein